MKLEDKLLEKSIESFIMAIEVYNKPSIKYRVEGFAFFICNAWELMLKSHMIKTIGESSIYYRDNPNRTISIENCIEKVFTNDKDPLRLNLKKIIELRNTSTHFVVEEYEMVYVPLFQACVFNFAEKLHAFHNYDIENNVPFNFLTISINTKAFENNEIRIKYPTEIAEHLISLNEMLGQIKAENNNRFSIKIDHYYYLTKNKDIATATVSVNNNANNSQIKIVKELKDPNDTHKYSCKACCQEITKRLVKLNIPITFNFYHFNLFDKYYGIKNNKQFSYEYRIQQQGQWSYSLQLIDFIVEEIKKDPNNIIQNIKKSIKNKSTPGAKEF